MSTRRFSRYRQPEQWAAKTRLHATERKHRRPRDACFLPIHRQARPTTKGLGASASMAKVSASMEQEPQAKELASMAQEPHDQHHTESSEHSDCVSVGEVRDIPRLAARLSELLARPCVLRRLQASSRTHTDRQTDQETLPPARILTSGSTSLVLAPRRVRVARRQQQNAKTTHHQKLASTSAPEGSAWPGTVGELAPCRRGRTRAHNCAGPEQSHARRHTAKKRERRTTRSWLASTSTPESPGTVAEVAWPRACSRSARRHSASLGVSGTANTECFQPCDTQSTDPQTTAFFCVDDD